MSVLLYVDVSALDLGWSIMIAAFMHGSGSGGIPWKINLVHVQIEFGCPDVTDLSRIR